MLSARLSMRKAEPVIGFVCLSICPAEDIESEALLLASPSNKIANPKNSNV